MSDTIKKLKKFQPLLSGFLRDNDKKNFFDIIRDLIKLQKKRPDFELFSYFNSLMYKNNAGNLDDYLSRKSILKINNFHALGGAHFYLDNKIRFAEKMTALEVQIPQYLGNIENGSFNVVGRDNFALKFKEDLLAIIDELVEIHDVIFIKEAAGLGGKAVHRYRKSEQHDISKIDITKNYMIDKGLIQHKTLNSINPNCINTLRVLTVNYDGVITIPNSFLRMGVGTSHVDNASSGGIFINYNLYTDSLDEIATKLSYNGGTSYLNHPDTKFVFREKKLPYPNLVRDLVIRAAEIFPEKCVVGWDIGYTPEGPVLLEGNSNPDVLSSQILLRGLKSNKIYQKIYKPFYDEDIYKVSSS